MMDRSQNMMKKESYDIVKRLVSSEESYSSGNCIWQHLVEVGDQREEWE